MKKISDLLSIDVLYAACEGLHLAISADHEVVESLLDWVARACLRRMEREQAMAAKTKPTLTPIGLVPLSRDHSTRADQFLASRLKQDQARQAAWSELRDLLATLDREEKQVGGTAVPRQPKTKLKN